MIFIDQQFDPELEDHAREWIAICRLIAKAFEDEMLTLASSAAVARAAFADLIAAWARRFVLDFLQRINRRHAKRKKAARTRCGYKLRQK